MNIQIGLTFTPYGSEPQTIFFSDEVLYEYPEFNFNIEPTAVDSQELDLSFKYKTPSYAGDYIQNFQWNLANFPDLVSVWIDDILYIEGRFAVDKVSKLGYLEGKITGSRLYKGAYQGDFNELYDMLSGMFSSTEDIEFVFPENYQDHCVLSSIGLPNQYYEPREFIKLSQVYEEENSEGSWDGEACSDVLVTIARLINCLVAKQGHQIVFFPKYQNNVRTLNLIETVSLPSIVNSFLLRGINLVSLRSFR